jgi:hypothetical protein
MDVQQVLNYCFRATRRSMSSFDKQLGNRPEVTVQNVNRVYPTMNQPPIRHPRDIFWSLLFR